MGFRGSALGWAWVVALAGCAAGWPVAGAPPRVLRVDARALPGGDGGPGRPFRTLMEAVEASGTGEVELQVAPGEYAGGWHLRAGMRVVGSGAVLVHAPDGCVVRASGGLLQGVMVQGGEVGVCAEGEVRLRAVNLSGQRVAGLRVAPGASLEGVQLQVEATLPDVLGVALQPGAQARLVEARFDGPFQRAVVSEEADLQLSGCAFHDARTAVQGVGGRLRLHNVYAGGGRGPAVYLGRAQAELEGLQTDGHEYGLLVGAGARVSVRGLSSRGAARAGVSFDQAEGELEEVTVVNPGNLGGVQLTGSRVAARRVEVKGPVYAAIQVLGGEASLRGVRIRHVSRESDGDGDGLVVHRAKVALEDASVEGAEGCALVAGSGAEVEVGALEARFVQAGAVFAGGKARVRVRSLQASGVGEAVVAAVEGARVRVDALDAGDAAAVAWADCAAASQLCVGAVRGTSTPQPAGACVELGTAARPVACR